MRVVAYVCLKCDRDLLVFEGVGERKLTVTDDDGTILDAWTDDISKHITCVPCNSLSRREERWQEDTSEDDYPIYDAFIEEWSPDEPKPEF